ncbi:hypothetical protein MUK42_02770 [Musa troglodytarum]|uniref:Uncharacterized protein n=1 Tax=Musa troglodytarum TaxID=320322 RepID=A0A9E7JJR4_9LILI|nr:hypothetical protein MUK42_02770 [Musa troglodytarum]
MFQMVVVLKKITIVTMHSEASEEFHVGIIRCLRVLNLLPCSLSSCSFKQMVIMPTSKSIDGAFESCRIARMFASISPISKCFSCIRALVVTSSPTKVADSNNGNGGSCGQEWRQRQTIAAKVADSNNDSDGSSRDRLLVVEEPMVLSLNNGRMRQQKEIKGAASIAKASAKSVSDGVYPSILVSESSFWQAKEGTNHNHRQSISELVKPANR